MFSELFKRIFGAEATQQAPDLSEKAKGHEPRNFFINLASLVFTKTGDQLMDPKITLSWLLTNMGAPALYLSLIVPVHNALSLLPQMAVAKGVRRFRFRRGFWSGGSIVQGLCLLVIAFAAVSLDGNSGGLLILAMLSLFSLARGVCSVTQKDVLGKTVAKTRRGRVSGLAESFASAVTVVLALWLLSLDRRSPEVVAGMLGVAAALWLLAAALFFTIAEPPQELTQDEEQPDSFASQLRFAFQQPQFNRYLLSRTALLGTALMPPYLVSLASLGEPGSLRLLGGLLLVSSLAGMLSGFVWGSLADRSSARCMRYAGLMAGFAGLIALFATQQDGWRTVLVSASVFLLYLAHAGVRVGRRTHMIDMTTQDDRSVLVAVSNTLIGVELLAVAAVAALLNGWLDYGGLMLCTALALLGAVLTTGLKEVQQPDAG